MKKIIISSLLILSFIIPAIPQKAEALTEQEQQVILQTALTVIMASFPYICGGVAVPTDTPEQAQQREKVRQVCRNTGQISGQVMYLLTQLYPEVCQKMPNVCSSILQVFGALGGGGGLIGGTTGPTIIGTGGGQAISTGPQAGGGGAFVSTGPQIQNSYGTASTATGCPSGISTINDIFLLVKCVLAGMVIPIIFILAFLVFLWGIVKFMKNGDNQTKRQEGLNFIWYGIVSLFVMTSVWGIVKIATTTLGVDGTYIPKVQSPKGN
jgi:hypothetical protein